MCLFFTGIQFRYQVSIADIWAKTQLYPRRTLCPDTTCSKPMFFNLFYVNFLNLNWFRNVYWRVFHSNSWWFVYCNEISGLEDELERRALTYTSWNQSAAGSKKRSWHPIKFDFADAGPQKIREIKVSSYIEVFLRCFTSQVRITVMYSPDTLATTPRGAMY